MTTCECAECAVRSRPAAPKSRSSWPTAHRDVSVEAQEPGSRHGQPTLNREVWPVRRILTARQVVLAVIGCVAVLLASQQCAAGPSRLDAGLAMDPLPGRER